MELPLQRKYSVEITDEDLKVSILVLMELPLQLCSSRIQYYSFRSFNPCFNGTTSATTTSFSKAVEIAMFQSLF